MIYDKKIEDAAKDYIDENNYFPKYDEDPCEDIEFAYKDGAKWAINEFLKDLWHPVSEKPRRHTPYLAQLLPASPFETSIPFETFSDSKLWERFSEDGSITRWLYIDDLFPKKEGKLHVKK